MPSYTQYKWQLSVLDSSDEDITWITVKGNHIPIKKGQTAEQATKAFFERKKAEANKAKHETAHADVKKKYDDLRAIVVENQKKFDSLYTDYESYKNDKGLQELALSTNKLRQVLSGLQKQKIKEEKYIKKYQDMLNQLDNSENKIDAPDVAKTISFGKMPHEQAKQAVDNLRRLQKKYSFMKGRLEYVGTQDSQEFKDWYKELVIEETLKQRYYSIIRSIEDARRTVEEAKKVQGSGLHTGNVWDEVRYNRAKRTLEQVEQMGEDGYARWYVETYYRTTKRFTSRVWAYYMVKDSGKSGSIVFNSQNYDTHGQDSGTFHPVGCNTPKSVLDHEFGHSVYYALELDKPFAHGEKEPLGKLRQFIVDEYSKKKEYITNNLSGYAATNLSEFFAEAFSEYENNPEPRPIAKTVGEYLETHIKELADGTYEKRQKESIEKLIGGSK